MIRNKRCNPAADRGVLDKINPDQTKIPYLLGVITHLRGDFVVGGGARETVVEELVALSQP